MTETRARAQYAGVSEPVRPPGGGIDAFDDVYQREFDYVYRTLGRLGVPPGDIPDGVHEVFLVLYRRWNELDPARPVRPWLFGVARRIAAALRRGTREMPALVDPESTDDPYRAERDLLWRALATLDDERRAVVILHDVEGHSGGEIAEMLELPLNTVYSRLRLARADLAAAVRSLGGTP